MEVKGGRGVEQGRRSLPVTAWLLDSGKLAGRAASGHPSTLLPCSPSVVDHPQSSQTVRPP